MPLTEIPETYLAKWCNRKVALKFLRKIQQRHGKVEVLVTDRLRFDDATMIRWEL